MILQIKICVRIRWSKRNLHHLKQRDCSELSTVVVEKSQHLHECWLITLHITLLQIQIHTYMKKKMKNSIDYPEYKGMREGNTASFLQALVVMGCWTNLSLHSPIICPFSCFILTPFPPLQQQAPHSINLKKSTRKMTRYYNGEQIYNNISREYNLEGSSPNFQMTQ